MSKKLSLTMMKEENKKYLEKVKVDLTDDVHTFIYPNFSPSKIATMLTEVLTDKLTAQTVNMEDAFDEINGNDWFIFNIIKFFADLGIPSDIKKKIQAYMILRDSDYYPLIIQAFPEESIKKVSDALEKANENLIAMEKYNQKDVERVVKESVPAE